jgi:hypothetical protein
MVNMLFVSQHTIGAEGWVQEALQTGGLVIISDGEERCNFFAID